MATNTWTWRYVDADGADLDQADAESFPNQSDAESWLGENWRELATSGVAEVELREGDRVEYRMPLSE